MPLIDTKKNSLLFKQGGLPLAANVVNIEEQVLISPDVKTMEYKEMDGELANTKSYIDGEHTTTTFNIKAKLRGNDKTGAAPDAIPAIADLLKASGLSEAVTASTSVEYTIDHGSIVAAQAIVYMDGKKRSADGIVCNFKLTGSVGECAIVEFEAQGYTDIAETDESNPTVTLDKEALMLVNKVSAVTIAGSTFNLQSFEFDLGNEIQDIYAIDLAKFERVDLDPKITLTGYKDSTDTSWTKFANETVEKIVITLGTGNGKTVTLTIDSAFPLTPSESDNSGKLNISKTYRCLKDSTSGNHFELKWS